MLKLEEEKKKFDSLLDEKLELDEKLDILKRSMTETSAKVKKQDEVVMIPLKAKIDG